MEIITITNLNISRNAGINAEQSLRFALHGYTTSHDCVAFDKGSDIDDISVKASHFTLASGNLLSGDNREQLIDEYFSRVHSSVFVYVARDFTVYMMNANEFKSFLLEFTALEHESQKNGGKIKVRAKAESKRMREWLNERAG